MVARRGNLATAAKDLHLTASALSHALRGLETELGCRLFDRTGKRMLLNQAGHQLLAEVEGPLAAIDRAAGRVQQVAQDGTLRLNIGAAASACRFVLPSVLREMRKRFDRLEVLVDSGDMPETLLALRDRRVDLALGVLPGRLADFDYRTVFMDELLLVLCPRHLLAKQSALSATDLTRQHYILYRRSSVTTGLVRAYFRKHGSTLSTTMEVASIEAIKELVKLDLGVSILAPWTVEHEIKRGTLCVRPLGRKPLKRHWAIAFLKGRKLTPVEETFCRLCRAHTAGLRLDRKDIPKIATKSRRGSG